MRVPRTEMGYVRYASFSFREQGKQEGFDFSFANVMADFETVDSSSKEDVGEGA